MDKESRNTIFIVVVVLIVCIVTLIAVGTLTWSLAGNTTKRVVGRVSEIFRSQNLDYNFDIPEISAGVAIPNDDENIASSTLMASKEYNYNFPLPEDKGWVIDSEVFALRDAIIDDAKLAGYSSRIGETGQTNMRIVIPKIAVDSPVWQGLGADNLLNKGFWVYPASGDVGAGEVVMLCHRRQFGPNDARSCWYLDQVGIGDQVFIDFFDTRLEYKVIETRIYEANDPNIYNISQTEDLIRIVTCHPLYSNTERFVVIAKREK